LQRLLRSETLLDRTETLLDRTPPLIQEKEQQINERYRYHHERDGVADQHIDWRIVHKQHQPPRGLRRWMNELEVASEGPVRGRRDYSRAVDRGRFQRDPQRSEFNARVLAGCLHGGHRGKPQG